MCRGNGSLVDNIAVHVGEHYWYNSIGTVNNVSLNGGQISVCGNLTLNGFNFNSGGLIINSGAILTINGSISASGSYIYNHGTLIINGDLYLNGNPTIFVNAPGSTLQVTGAIHVNSTSTMVIDNSNTTANTLVLQSSGSPNLCMCGGSIDLVNLYNNNANSVSAPFGPTCISYTGNAVINSNLTTSSNVNICQGASATAFPANWGAANVITNCTGCSSLPIQNISFDAQMKDNNVLLSWKVENISFSYLVLEKSPNGIIWQDAQRIFNPNIEQHIDTEPYQKENFYRLKVVSKDGVSLYSTTRFIYNPTTQVSLYYRPATSEIIIDNIDIGQNWYLYFYDTQGRIVSKYDVKSNFIKITDNHSQGIYIAQLVSNKEQLQFKVALNR
ncbi:MAG: T9SS type A sorting domain-containing protein [Bacteroidia bacterium]|nr:T9SS type A sorting domain-containing protein [Bacteroidia bacterium]MDW8346530.1 T9SS type A sorting domain-containing protein [Bacteroidia bacterium]